MQKNVAGQKIAVFAYDSSLGTPKTGLSDITLYVNKDWAGVGVLGDTTATELSSTNAKGWYVFDLTQGETNADVLHFTGKSATSNVEVVGQLISTLPESFTAFNNPLTAAQTYAAIGLASANLDTQISALSTLLNAITAKTTNLPASPASVSDIPTAAQNADKFLGRNLAGGSDGGRTVQQALYPTRNKVVITSTTMTVYEVDDTTASFTATLGTDSAAVPIVSVDPA